LNVTGERLTRYQKTKRGGIVIAILVDEKTAQGNFELPST
jgi:hypothetical protein